MKQNKILNIKRTMLASVAVMAFASTMFIGAATQKSLAQESINAMIGGNSDTTIGSVPAASSSAVAMVSRLADIQRDIALKERQVELQSLVLKSDQLQIEINEAQNSLNPAPPTFNKAPEVVIKRAGDYPSPFPPSGEPPLKNVDFSQNAERATAIKPVVQGIKGTGSELSAVIILEGGSKIKVTAGMKVDKWYIDSITDQSVIVKYGDGAAEALSFGTSAPTRGFMSSGYSSSKLTPGFETGTFGYTNN